MSTYTTHACTRPPIGKDAKTILGFLIFTLIASSQFGGYMVFNHDADRAQMAYLSFWAFDFAMYGMMLLPWLPLPSLKNHSAYDRLSVMVQFWVFTYIAVALTFEVPWLLLYEKIAVSRDAMWAYPFWAYIDGGDVRYLNPDLQVIYSEISACVVAFFSAIAITVWLKSGRRSAGAVCWLMFGAATHISPTIMYYTLEIVQGFPNVDLEHPGNWLAKFILSNSCWFWMPFVVWFWGVKTLRRLYTGKA